MVTLLAPTDAGIQNAIGAVGGIEALLSDPSRISDILNYHLLSSQIQVSLNPEILDTEGLLIRATLILLLQNLICALLPCWLCMGFTLQILQELDWMLTQADI